MTILELQKEEGELLLKILENYHSHLEVEVHRTHYRDFRKALEEREKSWWPLSKK